MPKVSAEISPELNQRLKEHTVKTEKSLRGGQAKVIAKAIEEYLDRHAEA